MEAAAGFGSRTDIEEKAGGLNVVEAGVDRTLDVGDESLGIRLAEQIALSGDGHRGAVKRRFAGALNQPRLQQAFEGLLNIGESDRPKAVVRLHACCDQNLTQFRDVAAHAQKQEQEDLLFE